MRNLYIANGKWYIRLVHNGKEHRRSTGIGVELTRGGKPKAPSGKVLKRRQDAVDDPAAFAESLIKSPTKDLSVHTFTAIHENTYKDYPPATLESVARVMGELRCRFQGMNLDDVKREDSIDWKEELQSKGLRAATVNTRLSLSCTMWNRAIERGRATANPFLRLSSGQNRAPKDEVNKRIVKCLEFDGEDEEAAIYAELPDWMKPIFKVSIFTGMRLNEIVTLEKSWIDLKEAEIILPKEHTKAGRLAKRAGRLYSGKRPIPLDAETLTHAKMVNRFGNHKFFFSDKDGAPLTGQLFQKNLRYACYRAGVNHYCEKRISPQWARCNDRACICHTERKITVHQLRRTATTRFFLTGKEQWEVKEMLGWSSDEIVEIYNCIDPKHLKRARDRLDVAMSLLRAKEAGK